MSRAVIVRPLLETPVRPNHLTALRLVTGLAAAAALALGTHPWIAVGGGLFVVSMLLDRSDGDLARLTGRTSPGGHVFDLVTDSLCNSLIFVGLAIGLVGSDLGWWAILLGALAGGGVAAVLFLVLRVEAMEGQGAAGSPSVGAFDADDAMLAIPVAVWLGLSLELLVAAAIGAPLFALYFVWRLSRRS